MSNPGHVSPPLDETSILTPTPLSHVMLPDFIGFIEEAEAKVTVTSAFSGLSEWLLCFNMGGDTSCGHNGS